MSSQIHSPSRKTPPSHPHPNLRTPTPTSRPAEWLETASPSPSSQPTKSRVTPQGEGKGAHGLLIALSRRTSPAPPWQSTTETSRQSVPRPQGLGARGQGQKETGKTASGAGASARLTEADDTSASLKPPSVSRSPPAPASCNGSQGRSDGRRLQASGGGSGGSKRGCDGAGGVDAAGQAARAATCTASTSLRLYVLPAQRFPARGCACTCSLSLSRSSPPLMLSLHPCLRMRLHAAVALRFPASLSCIFCVMCSSE